MDLREAAKKRGHDLFMFGAGCFWGVEADFRDCRGVVSTAVGYSGGHVPHPSYEQVCTHETGHAETVLVEFDPTVVSLEELMRVFLGIHDPFQGSEGYANYRSVIFYFDEAQHHLAHSILEKHEREKGRGRLIATTLERAGPFYMAEDYHQRYYEKRSSRI